jgi:hypothetical protein
LLIVRKLSGFGSLQGFDIEAYRRRLRIMREVLTGENQTDFAARLEIDYKRWSNYERGYPVPREVAFLLRRHFPGMSIEWIWFGDKTKLSPEYKRKVEIAEKLDDEQNEALAEMAKIKKRLDAGTAKRKRVLHPVPASKGR